jgi:hypothetical protein
MSEGVIQLEPKADLLPNTVELRRSLAMLNSN